MSDPRELAAAYFAALSAHDVDAVTALVSDDFVNEHTGEMAHGSVGKAAYRERLPAFFAGLSNLSYHVERLIVDGNCVVGTYTLTATIGTSPIEVRGVMVIDTHRGLIMKRTDYWDGLTVQHQLDNSTTLDT